MNYIQFKLVPGVSRYIFIDSIDREIDGLLKPTGVKIYKISRKSFRNEYSNYQLAIIDVLSIHNNLMKDIVLPSLEHRLQTNVFYNDEKYQEVLRLINDARR